MTDCILQRAFVFFTYAWIIKIPDDLFHLFVKDHHAALIEKTHTDGKILGVLQIVTLVEFHHFAAAVFVGHYLIAHCHSPFG